MKYGYVKLTLDEYNHFLLSKERLSMKNIELIEKVEALEKDNKDMKSIINRLSSSHKKLLEFIEDNGLEFKENKDE